MTTEAIRWYDNHLADVSDRYESVKAEAVHSWLSDLIPKTPAVVLDVGSGTGRDAAWLASLGLDVVAVEPSAAMRTESQRLHPSKSIRWLADSLPALDQVFRLGLAFDMILLSAVWMHVPPADRTRAFRKLITLLKPGGLIAITLRMGGEEPDRGIHEVSLVEIEHLARTHGAFVERVHKSGDALGRETIQWIEVAVRLPDDGSGALPLLRHIILNEGKSSTYKLALLRTLCRIADGSAGCARDTGGDHVGVPLGLVGLYWIRLFKPLLAANLPQSPTNRGDEGLGFVKDGFRRLNDVSHLDLRIGMVFRGDRLRALHEALRDACDTIARMPAHYMTYPGGGGPVFPVRRGGRFPLPGSLQLDNPYLWSFGELLVPRHLWRALQHLDVWIEPALIAEWARLMAVYAGRQNRTISEFSISTAMKWSDPSRDVRIAREQAMRVIESTTLRCVWSGRTLSAASLDIDHCFPWSAWPCDDLWNLLPTHQHINRHEKRNKLPGSELLRAAQERIQVWWDNGYLRAGDLVLPERFMTEVKATLPSMAEKGTDLGDVFAALRLQQIRLKHDQQIPIWDPSNH